MPLEVWLYGTRMGTLGGTTWRDFDFTLSPAAIARFGVLDYDVRIGYFDGRPLLLVERYDRIAKKDGTIRRVHQEDMNQALGASGNQKYQKHGGVSTLRRISQVVSHHGPGQLNSFLKLVVFSAAIGNLDFHAKNISLLHLPDGRGLLAPAYDNVPLLHQPTDGELALAVNGIYRLADVRLTDLAAEAESWGMSDQTPRINTWLAHLDALVDTTVPSPGTAPDLPEAIKQNISRLRS